MPSSTYALVITASDLSHLTGHHNFTCHIEETTESGETIHSVPAVFGIERTVLQSRFGGDPVRWREWVKTEMIQRHQATQSVHMEVLRWSGQRY